MRRMASALLLLVGGAAGQLARGPILSAHKDHDYAGWVADAEYGGPNSEFKVADIRTGGSVEVRGDNRIYLVKDHRVKEWKEHSYVRVDLMEEDLHFTLDISNVACGCIACFYLVAMKDPDAEGNNYCGAPLRPAPDPR
jgi:hypothetical protein